MWNFQGRDDCDNIAWVGCFLVSLSILIFHIFGYKGIAGGLTFYPWVSRTVWSNSGFRYSRAGGFHFSQYVRCP